MGVVAAGSRRTALAFHGRVAATALFLGLSLGGPFACTARDVFLVPGHATGGSGANTGGAGATDASSDARWIQGDGAFADSGCAVDHYAPSPTPLGVYILVNQSSSMSSVWTPLRQALVDFVVGSGQETGISAGVEYFPDLDNATGDLTSVCQAATYGLLDVPIAPLPANELPLIDSFGAHGPDAMALKYGALAALQFVLVDSPADAALSGAISAAKAWQAAQTLPGARAVILFVTNGVPGTATSPACLTTLSSTVNVVAAGLAGTPSISTYVLGMGDLLTELDAIAQAGGTGAAHIVSSTSAADIVKELVGLRGLALPCAFTIDPSWLTSGRVNVDRDGPTPLHLSRVLGPNACSGTTGSWYGADPDRIVICPDTCDAARAAGAPAFDVVYGCPTIEGPR